MTVADRAVAYLQKKQAGESTDRERKELATGIDELFKALQKARLSFDLRWYINQRAVEGDHELKFDPSVGRVTTALTKKKHFRTINLVKAQLRGIKNFVQKVPITVEFSPDDDSEEAKQEAKEKNRVWRAIEHTLGLENLKRPVVHDALVKSTGYIALLPTDDGFISAHHYDTFDAYPDPTVPSILDGNLFILATRQNLQSIKQNKAYENTGELQGDGRLAASDYKNSLEQAKMGGQSPTTTGDLASLIWTQLFIKLPWTRQPVTGPDGQPALGEDGQPVMELKPSEKPRIWILTASATDVHRCEETNLTQFPPVPYYPEKFGNQVYLPAWMDDLLGVNKVVNNLVSTAEEWHMKAKPKLLVPSDSKLKEIKDVTAEVLTYDKRVPADGIKDYMPSGLPESFFRLLDVCRTFIADIGGMHESSMGVRPQGISAARAIESLKAGDAEANIAEPLANFGLFWQQLAERAFELLAKNLTTQRTLVYPEGDDTQKVTFIGEAGLKKDDQGQPIVPEGVIVIRPSKVRVTVVPSIAYTEEGKRETLREMYKDELIDRKTVLEGYRFSNVAEIAEAAEAEQAKKSQQPPPPPPPVPGDKLLTALSSVMKSGGPVTNEQLQEAMKQAGLPPEQIDAVMNPAPIDAPREPATMIP